MDLLGIKGEIAQAEKTLDAETAQVFNRLDLSISKAVAEVDELLTKHEGNLEDLRIVISFEKKPNPGGAA